MSGVALMLSVAAVSATPGVLQQATDLCFVAEAEAGIVTFAGNDESLPELVRNFIANPPRFPPTDELRVARLESESGTVWVVLTNNECEGFLTQSPDHMAARDAFIGSIASDETIRMPRSSPFWAHSVVVTHKNGKSGLLRMQGLGPDNAKQNEIQLDFSIIMLAN